MAPKKHILYICPSSGIGGAETFIKSTVNTHSSTYKAFYLLFSTGPLYSWLKENGAHVTLCKNKPKLSRPWTWFLYAFELVNYIKINQIHLTHSTMAYAAIFSWPSYFFCKHIWFQHGPVSGSMDTLAYALPCHGVMFNSNYSLKQQLNINFKWIKKQNVVIPLGVKQAKLEKKEFYREQFLKDHNLPSDSVLFAMACRLQRWKGVDIAIKAFQIALNKTNKNIFLCIFSDNKWDEQYESELKSLKTKNTYFFETTSDIYTVFLASDFIINSSIIPEPFGLTIIEAMACQAIPLCSNAGGPQEILNNHTELLFEIKNADDLSKKIMSLINDSIHIKETKSRIYQTYLNMFTDTHQMHRLENFYQQILDI